MEIYIVQSRDTVDKIASVTGSDVEDIIFDNQLVYPYELAVGQALLVGNHMRNATRVIASGGYAYPFISEWVLRQTLPYLSELSVFSYGFTTDGNLIPPFLGDDQWMIQAAYQFGTQPILTLTPFDASGNFNNMLIHSVINNEEYTEKLIHNLIYIMQEKGYQGVDIDFEYILPQDRDAFSSFVRRVSDAMRANGYHTSVALAPKTSSDQPGLLYEGKDYRALGEAADHVLLMTYEWGYTYGPPMAVAPINQVRRVVEYALTQIPEEKIDLGIPNYGYDWPLPYQRGITRATTINNIQAIRIAVQFFAEIKFDEVAKSPYFTYVSEGIEHEVWFEDVRSLSAKFDLVKEYHLRGCTYWTVMQWFRANWLLLKDFFYIRK